MDSTASKRLTDEELHLFSTKIGHRLAERPADLDPGTHRERVAGLMRLAGDASFYRLLDVPPTSTAQEIHEAYERIARLVHPANAERLGLEGREGVLEMLFERLTQAYLTLVQPDRRKGYDRELEPSAWRAASSPAPGRRREEARDVAKRYYDRALELAAADDYHFAIELLQQAVRTDDSRPEYVALLGRLQAKNSRWLRAAAENLEKALKLGSRDPEVPAALAAVRQRLAAGEALRAPTAEVGIVSPSVRSQDPPEVEVLDPGGEFEVPLPPGQAFWK